MRTIACLGVAVLLVMAAACGSAKRLSSANSPADCWQTASAVRPGNAGNNLSDIAALTPTDAWAVGVYVVVPRRYLPGLTTPGMGGGPPPESVRTLIEHWDGKTWTRVHAPSEPPPQGDSRGGFTRVAAMSGRDVWVVGSGDSPATTAHWDGRA